MEKYVGGKEVKATRFTLGAYNFLRGRTLPEELNPLDDGYLIEHLDCPIKNHADFSHYISWMPKEVFENLYKLAKETTFLERLIVEEEELGKKIVSLNAALANESLVSKIGFNQFRLLALQHSTMISYRQVLKIRIEDLKPYQK